MEVHLLSFCMFRDAKQVLQITLHAFTRSNLHVLLTLQLPAVMRTRVLTMHMLCNIAS